MNVPSWNRNNQDKEITGKNAWVFEFGKLAKRPAVTLHLSVFFFVRRNVIIFLLGSFDSDCMLSKILNKLSDKVAAIHDTHELTLEENSQEKLIRY